MDAAAAPGYLVVLLVLSLALEASCKDPCSKDWLRYMVVKSCGMDKRHLGSNKPHVSLAMKEILNEVDAEFENWKHGKKTFFGDDEDDDDDYDDDDSSASSQRIDVEIQDKNRASQSSTEALIVRLFQHPGQVLADAWMGLIGTETKRTPRRRAIENLISRCCSEDCAEDAFEGVCD